MEVEWDNIRVAFELGLARRDAEIVGFIPAALGSWHAVGAVGVQEAGRWARTAITSGLLDGDRNEIDVRGAWAHWAYVSGQRAEGWDAISRHLDRINEDQRSTFAASWFLIALGQGDADAIAAMLDTRRH